MVLDETIAEILKAKGITEEAWTGMRLREKEKLLGINSDVFGNLNLPNGRYSNLRYWTTIKQIIDYTKEAAKSSG